MPRMFIYQYFDRPLSKVYSHTGIRCKDERLVIGIGHNRDNRSMIIIATITINLYVIIGIIGQNRCDYNQL